MITTSGFSRMMPCAASSAVDGKVGIEGEEIPEAFADLVEVLHYDDGYGHVAVWG
jgi:hypothetical protein